MTCLSFVGSVSTSMCLNNKYFGHKLIFTFIPPRILNHSHSHSYYLFYVYHGRHPSLLCRPPSFSNLLVVLSFILWNPLLLSWRNLICFLDHCFFFLCFFLVSPDNLHQMTLYPHHWLVGWFRILAETSFSFRPLKASLYYLLPEYCYWGIWSLFAT